MKHLKFPSLTRVLPLTLAAATLALPALPGCILIASGGDEGWGPRWDCVECDVSDADNDGVSDNDELSCNLDPNNADSDNDGVLDADEDLDGDGRTTAEEIAADTDCAVADDQGGDEGEGEGEGEGNEGEGEPPPPPDADDDGLSDEQEEQRGTDANDADSDDDGQCDGAEVECGSSPLDPFFTCT